MQVLALLLVLLACHGCAVCRADPKEPTELDLSSPTKASLTSKEPLITFHINATSTKIKGLRVSLAVVPVGRSGSPRDGTDVFMSRCSESPRDTDAMWSMTKAPRAADLFVYPSLEHRSHNVSAPTALLPTAADSGDRLGVDDKCSRMDKTFVPYDYYVTVLSHEPIEFEITAVPFAENDLYPGNSGSLDVRMVDGLLSLQLHQLAYPVEKKAGAEATRLPIAYQVYQRRWQRGDSMINVGFNSVTGVRRNGLPVLPQPIIDTDGSREIITVNVTGISMYQLYFLNIEASVHGDDTRAVVYTPVVVMVDDMGLRLYKILFVFFLVAIGVPMLMFLLFLMSSFGSAMLRRQRGGAAAATNADGTEAERLAAGEDILMLGMRMPRMDDWQPEMMLDSMLAENVAAQSTRTPPPFFVVQLRDVVDPSVPEPSRSAARIRDADAQEPSRDSSSPSHPLLL